MFIPSTQGHFIRSDISSRGAEEPPAPKATGGTKTSKCVPFSISFFNMTKCFLFILENRPFNDLVKIWQQTKLVNQLI